MSTDVKTNLRESIARTKVVGTISEMKLEDKKTDDGREMITGYVTVKTSDVNFVRFNASASKFTREGKENSIYAGLITVRNEYKSIADVGEEEATKVIVNTKQGINPYTGRDGREVVGFKSNFFNRYNGPLDDFEPSSEFEVELFISSIMPEVNADGETGRVLVKGWMPTYNGVEPLTLVADGETGEAIMDEYEVGQTVLFMGDIVNNRIEHKKEIPMKIGKPKIEITYETKNDMLITGASEPYDEDAIADEDKPFDAATIKLAIQERQNRLDEAKNKTSTNATTSKPSGASRGRTLGF